MRLNFIALLVASIVAVLMTPALPADAGSPTYSTVTLGAATGASAFTNTLDYYALRPVSLEVFSDKCLTNVVTVQRIRSARTNTVCTLTLAAGAGLFSTTNTLYLFKNDVYVFSSSVSTGGVVELVFEQQP